MTLTILGYAFLGGLLPSLVWLYFILQEDARCPEPRSIITLSFIVGMIAVLFAVPLEIYAKATFTGTALLISWATIEEVLKYAMAAGFILWRLGHLPHEGENFAADDLAFEIVKLDGRNIARVRIKRVAEQA